MAESVTDKLTRWKQGKLRASDQSLKPGQPPSGADFSALVKKVNEVAVKTGVTKLNETITGKIPAWKRYVGSEAEYDTKGLRDVVNGNALFLDAVKGDTDAHGQAIIELRADVQVLKEAPAARPFP
jgi:hypothetical protein